MGERGEIGGEEDERRERHEKETRGEEGRIM